MMNRILAAILLFLLHISIVEAASSSAKKDRWDGVPVSEIYRKGTLYTNEAKVDSLMYYFGILTDRYNKENIGSLNRDDRIMVTNSYYQLAMSFWLDKNDYVNAVRYAMGAVEICEDSLNYYYLCGMKYAILWDYYITVWSVAAFQLWFFSFSSSPVERGTIFLIF